MNQKCAKCGLVNWSNSDSCKRCNSPIFQSNNPAFVEQPKKTGYSITEIFVALWFFGIVGYGAWKAIFSENMGGENLIIEMGTAVGICVVLTIAVEIGRRTLSSSKT